MFDRSKGMKTVQRIASGSNKEMSVSENAAFADLEKEIEM